MIEPIRPLLRSNRASAPSSRSRLAVTTSGACEPWPERRPDLLTRVARAAQSAVRDVREAGDVPLPHLYRGRNFGRSRGNA
ncbi:hypothetical protein [Sphingosinicella sp. CPCC 101087]|uniref:hypothetical protein n=1 Tax=Sphingosinicella sp. CPCC 101087 TaxID=2497754 RepID=UPI00101B655B|nr:hypothetical protein [Sphingosinicella sp. CPCC 101087]